MALIDCAECGNKISDRAFACPKCGNPAPGVATPSPNGVPPRKVLTVEQTSKPYKVIQLVGVLMICAGVVACTAREIEASSWLCILGVVAYIGGRMGAWWNNG